MNRLFLAVTFSLAFSVTGTQLCRTALGQQGPEGTEPPVYRRSFSKPESIPPPFQDGNFEPQAGETIVLLGSTNAFDAGRHGFIETRLHLAWPEKKLRFRNLAWQGDTIDHQARPRNFYTRTGDTQPGSSPDTRERTPPGVVLLWFGKSESLEGVETAGNWSSLINDLRTHRTPRLVIVTPTPFFATGAAAALAKSRNQSLSTLVEELRQISSREELPLVDLFGSLKDDAADPAKAAVLSENGIHLTRAGHERIAERFARSLQFPSPSLTNIEKSPVLASLDQAIARKNSLWQQYYRPTNWAFLFGNRQHVPASRNPKDRGQRWFLQEIARLPGLIEKTEADIFRYAREIDP